jgi:hypothetical protein
VGLGWGGLYVVEGLGGNVFSAVVTHPRMSGTPLKVG